VKKAKQTYDGNKKVEVAEFQGCGHGFMNPACATYSEEHFSDCSQYVQQRIKIAVKKGRPENKRAQKIL
jgi:dienelactone hydrolase